jgi:hypothetical protein
VKVFDVPLSVAPVAAFVTVTLADPAVWSATGTVLVPATKLPNVVYDSSSVAADERLTLPEKDVTVFSYASTAVTLAWNPIPAT